MKARKILACFRLLAAKFSVVAAVASSASAAVSVMLPPRALPKFVESTLLSTSRMLRAMIVIGAVLLVYMAGIFAFAGGEATRSLLERLGRQDYS